MGLISSPFSSVTLPIRELQFDNYLRTQNYNAKIIDATNKSTTDINYKETLIDSQKVDKSNNTNGNDIIQNNVDKSSNNTTIKPYEVLLSSTNFGFNSETNDFYVKVTRGNITNQYPTEDMMKFKIFMVENLKN